MQARVEMYWRFVRKRCLADMEVAQADGLTSQQRRTMLDTRLAASQLNRYSRLVPIQLIRYSRLAASQLNRCKGLAAANIIDTVGQPPASSIGAANLTDSMG